MTIPKPQWHLISASQPATTGVTDIFVTLKSQIINSSSYWRVNESASTGTNSLILSPIGLVFPNMRVVIANSITGSTAYASPDTNAASFAKLMIGVTPDVFENGNTGTFVGSNADYPFGNQCRWSGYWQLASTSSVSTSFWLESEDIIGLCLKTTGDSAYAGFMGAILESYDSGSGESGSRNIGMITSGPSTISTTLWSAANTFMDHNSTAAGTHIGVFVVSGGVVAKSSGGATPSTATAAGTYWTTLLRLFATAVVVSSSVTANLTRVGLPVHYNAADGALRGIGKSRGLYQSSDSQSLVMYLTGSKHAAFALGGQTGATTAADIVLVGPFSGSGIT